MSIQICLLPALEPKGVCPCGPLRYYMGSVENLLMIFLILIGCINIMNNPPTILPRVTYHDIDPRGYEMEFELDRVTSNISSIQRDVYPRGYEAELGLDKVISDDIFIMIKSIALCPHIQRVFEVIEESALRNSPMHLAAYKHSEKCDQDSLIRSSLIALCIYTPISSLD